MDRESLALFLHWEGYNDEDIDAIVEAYFSFGIGAAVRTYEWADDAEHDFSGELRGVIIEWEKENNVERYPRMRIMIK